jgi:ribosomal protein S15P/S13E
MKDKCFDAETIQTFLDGELSSELLENVARHVALCDNCSLLLNEIEEESAFAFSLLDDELNALVPTERIRAGVYQAISQLEKPQTSFWQRLGIFASIYSLRNQPNIDPIPQVATNVTPTVEKVAPVPVTTPTAVELADNKPSTTSNEGSQRVVYKPQPKINKARKTSKDEKPITNNELPVVNIAGEATYLKTIATLEKTVDDKKDNVLRASSRVSYERDLAIINDSIKRMREEVRKNPKNEAAKQILRNSYQNKIELLNSVSDRSELMASLD